MNCIAFSKMTNPTENQWFLFKIQTTFSKFSRKVHSQGSSRPSSALKNWKLQIKHKNQNWSVILTEKTKMNHGFWKKHVVLHFKMKKSICNENQISWVVSIWAWMPMSIAKTEQENCEFFTCVGKLRNNIVCIVITKKNGKQNFQLNLQHWFLQKPIALWSTTLWNFVKKIGLVLKKTQSWCCEPFQVSFVILCSFQSNRNVAHDPNFNGPVNQLTHQNGEMKRLLTSQLMTVGRRIGCWCQEAHTSGCRGYRKSVSAILDDLWCCHMSIEFILVSFEFVFSVESYVWRISAMVRTHIITRHLVSNSHPSPLPAATSAALPQRCFGSSTSASSSTSNPTGDRQPNSFTQYVTRMKQVCPDAMQQYAVCVTEAQEAGKTLHGACEAEYAQVKECFRSVRQESFSSSLL